MRERTKRGLLRAARALGLFRLSRRLTARATRILCYHGVWLGDEGWPGDAMFMRAETFRDRLRFLEKAGYEVISLSQAIAGITDGTRLPPAPVVITIDDGWFSTFEAMLPALVEHRVPATLYCDTRNVLSGLPVPHVMARYLRTLKPDVTLSPAAEAAFMVATSSSATTSARVEAARSLADAIGLDGRDYLDRRVFAYMTPAELRSAAAAGLEIELHTHTHSLGDMSPARVREEIALNRAHLADILGRDPASFRHFCYPSGICSPGAGRALAEAGVASATTTRVGLVHPGDGPHLLARFLDGEQVSPIEFEAEMAGFSHIIRVLRARLLWPVADGEPSPEVAAA